MALLWTLVLNGLLGLGAYRLAASVFRLRPGPERWLGAAVLAWAWLTLGMQTLGTFGLLSRLPLLIWTTVGLVLGLVTRVAGGDLHVSSPLQKDSRAMELAAVVALGGVLAAVAILGGRSLLGAVKAVSDGPIYHLYFAVRWWKAGRLFLVATPFGENAATYFPAGGDLWFTWLAVGWGGDRLARVGQAPFLILAATASYSLARRLGAGQSSALVATCMFVASTPLLLFSLEPNVDTLFVAGYLTATYFLTRFAIGDDDLGMLVLGGLAAGCAWGTKPTGHVFVPVLLGLGTLAILLRPREPNTRWLGLATLAAGSLVPVGYWLARNAWLTGNPLYPLQVSAFGRVWLVGWYGPGAMRLSPYYLSVRDVSALVDILLAVVDPREAPFWLAALLGLWRLGARGQRDDCWVWGLAGLAVANAVLYWLLVPYRTQQRFMLHAMGLAVVPLARFLDRSWLIRVLASSTLLLHLTTPQPWPWRGDAIPWDQTVRIPNAVGAILDATASGVVVLLPLGLGLLAAWSWLWHSKRPAWRRLVLALVGTTTLGAFGAVAAWEDPATKQGTAFFPPSFPDYYRGWLNLDQRSGPRGTRVAYSGTDLPYYLFGMRLRNDVVYVNIDAHRDWLLHDYHRDAVRRGAPNWPTPRPGWDRIRPEYGAWLANLRAAEIQLLVVCRANPVEGAHNVADAQSFPIERRWAEEHPESFRTVYGVAEGDREFRIYRVLPPVEKSRMTTSRGSPRD
jgi:hypothetical protein